MAPPRNKSPCEKTPPKSDGSSCHSLCLPSLLSSICSPLFLEARARIPSSFCWTTPLSNFLIGWVEADHVGKYSRCLLCSSIAPLSWEHRGVCGWDYCAERTSLPGTESRSWLRHLGVFPSLLSTAATSAVVEGSPLLHWAPPLKLSTDQEPPKAAHLIREQPRL